MKLLRAIWGWLGRIDDAWSRLKILLATFGGILALASALALRLGPGRSIVTGIGLFGILFGVALWMRSRTPMKKGQPGWMAWHKCMNAIGRSGVLLCLRGEDAVIPAELFCQVDGPFGRSDAFSGDQIRPPSSAGANGVFNDYWYLVYPVGGGLLPDGRYKVAWLRKRHGLQLLRCHSFRITNGVCIDSARTHEGASA